MNELILITAIVCAVGMILSAWVTCCALKNIEKFGSDYQGKRIVTLKYLFNFYAIVILSFVVFVRAYDLINEQLFIALFVIILSGLGFKITLDAFKKNKS